MSATITTDGRIIRARVMDVDDARRVPGAQRAGINWVYPLSLATCRAFREVFGTELTVLPPLVEWANHAVAKEQNRVYKGRPCRRCGRPLTKGRLLANKFFCHPCELANRREAKERSHERYVGQEYGLEPGDYGLILEAQGGRCAVKGCRANGTTKLLAVEHDHKLGNTREAVRGLVCGMHNEWIGRAGDDPEVFESIAEFLRNPPAHKVLKRRRRSQ
jgi:hypothetical protein